MSEALIEVDMFSNSPQERPGETVSKKNRPQMYPCNISSPRRQMGPGGGEIVGVIRPKTSVTVFFGHSLNRERGCYCINFT